MSRREAVSSIRRAFTLVEMLIVIVLISIIAGVAIMQVGSSSEEAALSALFTNEQMLQSAIDRYKVDHGGQGPSQVSGDSLPQLTHATNAQGQLGTGAAYVFGPYLINDAPVNTVTHSRVIETVTDSPPANLTTSSAGWLYNPTTGQIWGVQGLASGSKKKLDAKISP